MKIIELLRKAVITDDDDDDDDYDDYDDYDDDDMKLTSRRAIIHEKWIQIAWNNGWGWHLSITKTCPCNIQRFLKL